MMHHNQRHFLLMVSAIKPEWLMELAPRYFQRMPATSELRRKLAGNNDPIPIPSPSLSAVILNELMNSLNI